LLHKYNYEYDTKNNTHFSKYLKNSYLTIKAESLIFLLLDTYYLILASSYYLLDTCYLLLDTCYLILTTCYLILTTCYLILTTCYLLLDTYYLLLATCYLLLNTYNFPKKKITFANAFFRITTILIAFSFYIHR
jgi:hypothetical protein